MKKGGISQKLTSFFLAFVMILGVAPQNVVYAQGDISSIAVTNLQVSPTEIQDGGNTTVRVDFAENENHNIQAGDIITVTWSRETDIQFSGFQKELPLEVKGKNIGTVSIREDGATITFNSNVNNLDDVEGFISFEVQGRNFTQTSEEDTKIGNITSGDKTVSVNVKKSASGTTNIFYYKTGNMDTADTDHINWWLNANLEKSYVDDAVRIEDEIQDGQELVNDSFLITVTDYNNSSDEFSIREFEQRYPGSRIEINQNKITVYIPREWASLNVFSIYYKTKITNYEQSEFVNNSKAWYKENGKEAVNGEAFNYTVKNINASTGATGTVKAELKIFKKIEGTDIGIKGVQFQLKNDTGTVIKDGQSEFILETNEEGTANIKGLPIGKYKVKEISAPDWVDFDPVTAQNVTFEVKEDDIEGTLLNVDNKVKTINIPVQKKWIGAVAGPVTVQVKEENSDDVIAEYELKESEGWKHTFTGLKKYTNDGTLIKYKVEEKDVPQGYTVDYETDPTGKWIIKNVQNKIEVKVIKNWENAPGEHPIIKLQLLKNGQAEGNPIELTNGKTIYTWTNLDEADAQGTEYIYTVKEVGESGNSIKLEDTWYKVTYSGNPQTGLTVTNKKLTPWTPMIPPTRDVKVTKEWKDASGNNLEAPVDKIEVELFKDGEPTGKKSELTKNNNWSGEFKKLEVTNGLGSTDYCQYTVKEVGENTGSIKLDGKWFKVSYTGNMKDGFTVTNEKEAPPTPPTPTPKPKPNPPTPASNSPVPNKSTVPNTNINRTLPKSGDGSSISPYAWLMLTSGGLLVLIGYRRKKHVK